MHVMHMHFAAYYLQRFLFNVCKRFFKILVNHVNVLKIVFERL